MIRLCVLALARGSAQLLEEGEREMKQTHKVPPNTDIDEHGIILTCRSGDPAKEERTKVTKLHMWWAGITLLIFSHVTDIINEVSVILKPVLLHSQ